MSEKVQMRLNSWKEIANHVGRDLRTLSRWEKEYGFPVRRIGGTKRRSVFAYIDEIDEWMRRMPPAAAQEGEATPASVAAIKTKITSPWAIAIAAIVAGLTLAGFVLKQRSTLEIVSAIYSGERITALDSTGKPQWTLPLSKTPGVILQGSPAVLDIDGDGKNDVVACLEGGNAAIGGRIVGGELVCLSNQGRELRRLEFVGKIRIGGQEYEGPWPAGAWVSVEGTSAPTLIMAVHHFTSWPAVIVAFDPSGKILGEFVNAGWIKALQILKTGEGTRLLAGGISNSNDAGMLAVLNADDISGRSPEKPGYACDSCSTKKPLRYFVFPRSELNLNTQSQYNQVNAIEVFADRFTVHSLEVTKETAGTPDGIDAIYEFAPDLQLRHAYFNDHYWDVHRRLEKEGILKHSKAECPDRNGPRHIRQWTAERGWEDITM